MSKHTPGPWIMVDVSQWQRIMHAHDKRVIGDTLEAEHLASTAETIANARLMAAAPELLEMTKAFYEYAGRFCPNYLPKIRAALAKATEEYESTEAKHE